MTLWLLDTNVLSELRRPKPSRAVLDFIASQNDRNLFICTVAIAEIRFGIELQADSARREALHNWLERVIRPRFEGRVLEIDEDVMLEWRKLIERARKERRAAPQPDLIIAATALHHGMTIVSRDKRGFANTGVPLFNPWTLRA